MSSVTSSEAENSGRFTLLVLTLTPFLLILALTLIGCGQQPIEVAPEGAAPGIQTAIGPIPGSGQAPAVRPNPYVGNAMAASEGYKYFSWYNCSGCHGVHGGGGMGPSLRDAVWIYGGSPDHVFASISEGRSKGMPSWATKIPEDQIWKIVTYIEGLNTPNEIDPPTVPLVTQQAQQASANPAESQPSPKP